MDTSTTDSTLSSHSSITTSTSSSISDDNISCSGGYSSATSTTTTPHANDDDSSSTSSSYNMVMKGPRPYAFAPTKPGSSNKYVCLDLIGDNSEVITRNDYDIDDGGIANLFDGSGDDVAVSNNMNVDDDDDGCGRVHDDNDGQMFDTECSCGNCGRMPTQLECVCCVNERLEKAPFSNGFTPGPGKCLLQSTDVQNVLSTAAVRNSWFMKRRLSGFDGALCKFELMNAANYRHHAYVSYVSYIHGLLGKRRRRVIPSCIVNFIRKSWPDANAHYTGYAEALVDELAGVSY